MIEIHLRHGEASPVTGSLTEAGETQANVAASYIKAHFPRALRIGIHSGSRRAVETAQLLELPRTAWTKDERLREADWKGIPEPREFEPWAEMYDRVASSLKDWDARNADDDRIFVTHGGTLRMVRAYREGFIRSSSPYFLMSRTNTSPTGS
jgi:broad specificity phosphatase PhoE